ELNEQLFSQYSTFLEYCPMGEQRDRFDIQISNDTFLICLEVKIDSDENNNQTIRYFNTIQLHSARHVYLLYLTINKDSAACKEAILVSWKEISSIITSVLKNYTIPDFVKTLLLQYSNHIKNF
ncbi:MAG: PD-(D/E)XK nuclease family protein, partial [Desulfovibrionaceae bacterium]|nr:PD-(D/E)XK nuclease family protein [Desulfovibrionaceae bacterium]